MEIANITFGDILDAVERFPDVGIKLDVVVTGDMVSDNRVRYAQPLANTERAALQRVSYYRGDYRFLKLFLTEEGVKRRRLLTAHSQTEFFEIIKKYGSNSRFQLSIILTHSLYNLINSLLDKGFYERKKFNDHSGISLLHFKSSAHGKRYIDAIGKKVPYLENFRNSNAIPFYDRYTMMTEWNANHPLEERVMDNLCILSHSGIAGAHVPWNRLMYLRAHIVPTNFDKECKRMKLFGLKLRRVSFLYEESREAGYALNQIRNFCNFFPEAKNTNICLSFLVTYMHRYNKHKKWKLLKQPLP